MAEQFASILDKRLSRRGLLKAAGAAAFASAFWPASSTAQSGKLGFTPLAHGLDERHHLAKGYRAQTLIRWGDALLTDAPSFRPNAQSAQAQAMQFGTQNDFIAYFPIGDSSRHGLLCVNHEFAMPELMFEGSPKAANLTDEQQRIEMASVGCSVLEVTQEKGQWQLTAGRYNRRITATTPIAITGPAAGHKRLQTFANPQGNQVLGTFGNCAGGTTPWNSYLTCEENIDGYFFLGGYDGTQRTHHEAFGINNRPYHRWDKVDARFDVSREENEPNRFGWVLELDPFHPQEPAKKRTALGRFKHESATVVHNADGRVVVYSGDDDYFQCIYKFVSKATYHSGEAAGDLLDEGTLFAARFDADGHVHWLPLIHGQGGLDASNGFDAQGDVLIETRRAAHLLGATPMDRPEGIAVHPKTGAVAVAMTKNHKRLRRDAVNRRAPNLTGYILAMQPPGGDHTARTFTWDIVLEGGIDTLACPDNLMFDQNGTLWVATDGQQKILGRSDALFALDDRAQPHCFFRSPIGAEVTGPCLTPDGKTLFLSVQHPAEGSSFDAPSTRWPDFNSALPPRPSVLAIRKDDGGRIGS